MKQGALRFATAREGAARMLLFLYKRVASPLLHAVPGLRGGCRFQPTCSEYAAIAIAEHGLLRGGAMALRRLLSCHPFHRGGFDPVPLRRSTDSSGIHSGHGTLVPQTRD
jgi:putative membrane protein insertion efficiency factor